MARRSQVKIFSETVVNEHGTKHRALNEDYLASPRQLDTKI